jgi:hypothetical protein
MQYALRLYRVGYVAGLVVWTLGAALATGGMAKGPEGARLETARAFVRMRAEQDERERQFLGLCLGLSAL